jgi:hypothetical protein
VRSSFAFQYVAIPPGQISNRFIGALQEVQAGCRAAPAMTVLCARLPYLSSGKVSPWKNTSPGDCWLNPVHALLFPSETEGSLLKSCHLVQTLRLSHRAGLRRIEPEASRTVSVLNWLEKRVRTYLRGSIPATMTRGDPEDQTSELIVQGFWPIMVYQGHSDGGSGATIERRAAASDRLL